MINLPYGELSLTDSSPAQTFAEPISLAEAKVFLNLRTSTTAQDTLIQQMIRAAREVAEIHQGRDLTVKQYDLYLDQFPSEIYLREPLRSVDLIQATNSGGAVATLIAGTGLDYQAYLNRGAVVLSYSFDSGGHALIRFTSGYAPTHPFWQHAGSRLLIGMQQLIAGWYETRVPFEPNLYGGGMQEFPFSATPLMSWGQRIKVY